MQKITLLALSLALLSACSETADTTAPAVELPAMLATGTTQLSLADYQLPFTLIVPDSNRGIPEVLVTTYGETDVMVGPTFHVVIAEGGDLKAKTDALGQDILYKHTVLESGADFILYKSELPDAGMEPEFHFYAVKTVGANTYEIRDYSDEGGYAETVARFMLESVNHLIPNNE